MKQTLITEMIPLRQLKIGDGRCVGDMSTNVYAKFHCTPLRIKKALGIFRELIPTTRRKQLEWLFGTRLPGPKKCKKWLKLQVKMALKCNSGTYSAH